MNILLDLGAHKLQGVINLFSQNIIDSSYKIYSYEANPYVIGELLKKSDIFCKNHNIFIKIFNIAISDKNETVELNFDKNGLDSMGCNILINPPIKDLVYGSVYDWDQIKVESKNLKTIFNDLNISTEDNIIIKLDIEGMEYKVIPDIIELKNKFNISKIFVEWHDRLFYPNHKLKQNEMIELKEKLKFLNIECIDNDYVNLD